MKYFCCTLNRRNATRASALNGLDFVEVLDHAAAVDADRQRVLFVHFLKPVGASGLTLNNFTIDGGERITDIVVESSTVEPPPDDNVITLRLDQYGDFSIYRLCLVNAPADPSPPAGIDGRLSSLDFSFKVQCPTDFDCKETRVCPPQAPTKVDINYLAKDYTTIRRLMLDRMAITSPRWQERNPTDLGVMLVEMLAYRADQLSYQQDAVSTEAYIGTARRRISVGRHARLMDYVISNGSNARTWVHLVVDADHTALPGMLVIPSHTKLLTQVDGLATIVADDERLYRLAAVIFETLEPVSFLRTSHNNINFYTWSDSDCCLPRGATSATLLGQPDDLAPGQVLVFEEVKGARTGDPADADIAHRHVVRLTEVEILSDNVTGDLVTNIAWEVDDRLPFALCLSATADDGAVISDISVARGNMVLADHGLSIDGESLGAVPPIELHRANTGTDPCHRVLPDPVYPRYNPRLARGPVTQAAPYNAAGAAGSAFQWQQSEVMPELSLVSTLGADVLDWNPKRDLLESKGDREHFVLEIEDEVNAFVRFGNHRNGKRPQSGTEFIANYRIGNGVSGNIGADAIGHIVGPFANIISVRNPLPGLGGVAGEGIADIKLRAPIAYRTQERAVTLDDYARLTKRHHDVQKATASLRWTGSWHTAFVTIDRLEGREVSPEFEHSVRDHLEKFRLAGIDLEVDGPHFVALEIEMFVCCKPDYLRSEVKRELLDVLSSRMLPDSRLGVFHPDNFSFGQAVYLSPIYAAAQSVQGAASVEITVFQRMHAPDTAPLQSGVLPIGRLEIARLDNDPNYVEHGVLQIAMGGGR